MNNRTLVKDTRGAATELGYIFTFLLGVLLLSMFSIWAWDIETATRDRWNEKAIEMNLDDLASAIERADEASRLGNISYSESVFWRATEADETKFMVELQDNVLLLTDEAGDLDSRVYISGTGSGNHAGSIYLQGSGNIWIYHSNGITSISLERPQ